MFSFDKSTSNTKTACTGGASVLMPISIGAKTMSFTRSLKDFKERSGITPIMNAVCPVEDCLCQLDYKATAARANLDLDKGDKYDNYNYAFLTKKEDPNPNWPSKTGNKSGDKRGNNFN